MKWSIEELDGIEAVAPVPANPAANPPVLEVVEVVGRPGNHLLRLSLIHISEPTRPY